MNPQTYFPTSPLALPMPASDFTSDDLRDLTLLALVVAHGTDAELDVREIDTLTERLFALDPGLSGDDVISVFKEAAQAYTRLSVADASHLVEDLSERLAEPERRRGFALLRAVAEADEVMHPMESTVLRHVAQAWSIGPAFVSEGPTPEE